MKYVVKIRKTYTNRGALKAIASVTIDEAYVVHGVKVIETDKGRFIAMPGEAQKDKDGKATRRDVFHPINAKARGKLEAVVLKAYDEEINKANTEPAETEATPVSPETSENN
ncbi:MAG: SpoVG family protein [Eubacteriales bacterium]|nr:SpoVG family protein [Eubacteriales bacterium]MDD4474359.1 SpoVG family protein [Eubacteriales bacterium]